MIQNSLIKSKTNLTLRSINQTQPTVIWSARQENGACQSRRQSQHSVTIVSVVTGNKTKLIRLKWCIFQHVTAPIYYNRIFDSPLGCAVTNGLAAGSPSFLFNLHLLPPVWKKVSFVWFYFQRSFITIVLLSQGVSFIAHFQITSSPLRKEGWKCTQSNRVINHSKCLDLATRLEAIISSAADNLVFAFSLWNLIPTQHYPDRSHFLSLVTTDKSHGEYMWHGRLNSGKDGFAARSPVNYLMRRTPRMMTMVVDRVDCCWKWVITVKHPRWTECDTEEMSENL